MIAHRECNADDLLRLEKEALMTRKMRLKAR